MRRRLLPLLLWPAGLACACAGVAAQPAGRAASVPPVPVMQLAPVLQHHAALVHATYADALAAAQTLQQAVRRFVAAPSPALLAQARQAWTAARERYALTEAFRFYGGPIDGDDGPEPRLNSWPVDESFIDSLIDGGGPLDAATLAAQNQRGGEENVATGWHAIEYLLWGPDHDEHGPGDRPHTDFVAGAAAQAQRRGRYLLEATDLLVQDLRGVTEAWAPGQANYRRRFEQEGAASLSRIVTGLGTLARAELAGERLEVPLASQDQEDEQSCFSDTTHLDLAGDAQAIENVWRGRVRRLDGRVLEGPSLQGLVAARDPALAERLTRDIAAAVAAAQALQPPFDREIVGGHDAPGRQRVRRLIDSVLQEAAGLAEAARVLGLQRVSWRRAR